jgi:putative membrane protein
MKSIVKKWHALPFSVFIVLAACNNQGGDQTGTNDTTAAANKSDSSTSSGVRAQDQDFVKTVVAANMGEVKMAQLAEQKAAAKDVKELAQMLEKDHTAVLSELKGYASNKNIEVPSEETQEAKDTYNEFSKKSGKEFDKDWCEVMEKKHKQSISKFEEVANDANSDADLKSFVNKTLPTLRTHLDHVMQCKNKLK